MRGSQNLLADVKVIKNIEGPSYQINANIFFPNLSKTSSELLKIF
jgi:hypothetical protein